ncbi:SDR family NAD(P)-dependent oxidoreductase [Rhodococcus sp. IEGM 1381]|uniref:SDR family NAD(P)-dependent oxidoreductase n=1 Tax=Rhodococcus sp. IEGM 1381 TaxID=3047085 RepID=UPI0024B838E5|nr:SDR family NAD(P)-dependent oxidoreductase [Rhodococcus sp. IEGM 1381]MDI9897436.1 SDR family NAD(P)-dependent oxidoreductase [Rhodococcus sp. IEGM 1381]
MPTDQGKRWLEDDVALVTGGGSGIGRAVVDRYIAEGARVVVADIDESRLDDVRNEHGDRVATIVTDVRSGTQNDAAVALALSAFGKLDIVVANAGLGDRFTELVDLPADRIDDAFAQIFDVNVKGLIHIAKAALPALVSSRGCIVVTLSNSSFWPDGGGVVYIASKHAALGVMRQLAHEFAPHVRVNAVAPGATRTSIASPAAFGTAVSGPQRAGGGGGDVDSIAAIAPLRVFSSPEDHTGAYLLLAAGSESGAMTGTVIESDGGLGVRGLRRVRGGDGLPARLLGSRD